MKKWSIWIHNDTWWGKLKEKLFGEYKYKECDELAHAPPGFFELAYTDNQAEYVWFSDVKAWQCNFDHQETLNATRQQRINFELDTLKQMTNTQTFEGPQVTPTPPEGAYQ